MRKLKYYLPFIAASIIMILAFSSCVATKGQKRRFLAQYCTAKDSIVTVTKDSTVYKDSLVYIPTIVNNPVYLENPCKLLCDSLGRLKPFSRTQENGGLKSKVFTVGNVLAFDCRTDSLKARVMFLERYIKTNNFVGKSKILVQECEKEHRTRFDGFTYWWFWITAGILCIWILFKIFGTYLKNALSFLRVFLK